MIFDLPPLPVDRTPPAAISLPRSNNYNVEPPRRVIAEPSNQELRYSLRALINLLEQLLLAKQAELAAITNTETNSKEPAVRVVGPAEPTVAPVITKITPSRGRIGTRVTITGTGFTDQNTVYTSYNQFNLASPDGRTLTFTVDPDWPVDYLGSNKTADFPELTFRFYVKNKHNNLTKKPGEFNLDI